MPESAAPSPPRVFISYSWENEAHKEWAMALATRLYTDGIDVALDRWHLRPGSDRLLFMERAIAESEHVLLICSPEYASKSNPRERGVGWEALIITGALAQEIDQNKFIPILRKGDWNSALPVWLQSRSGIDLSDDSTSEPAYQYLLRELHGVPLRPPPLGPRPDFPGSVNQLPPSVSAGPMTKEVIHSKTVFPACCADGGIPSGSLFVERNALFSKLVNLVERQRINDLTLVGQPGSGKTQLAAAIARYCQSHNYAVQWIDAHVSALTSNIILKRRFPPTS